MSVEKIRPLEDRVLLRRDESEKVSPGGILLPDAAREVPKRGTVLAVGPGRTTPEGVRSPMVLSAGDVVLFPAWSGTEVPGEKDVLLIAQQDVLAIVG